MRLRAKLLVAFALAVGLAPAPALAGMRAMASTATVPRGYKLIANEPFTDYSLIRKKNGPAEEGGLITGRGRLSDMTTFGRGSPCIGLPGLGGEFYTVAGLGACNGAAGYPSLGQVSSAGGVTSITLEPTPASIAASLPTDATYGYSDFSSTCSATSGVMTCGAITGAIKGGVIIQGTGVTAGTQVSGYGTGNETTAGTFNITPSQSFGSTTVTSTRKWPYVSASLTTYDWLAFKPDKGFCYEFKMRLPSTPGSWVATWTYSRNDNFNITTGLWDTVAKGEIDHLEHFQGAGNTDGSTEFHWHAVAGGAYNALNVSTKMPFSVEGAYHWYRACGDAKSVDYYVDNMLVRHNNVPAAAIAWPGVFQYIIIDLAAGNSSAAFEGVYSPGVTSKLDLDEFNFYMRNDAVGCTTMSAGCDYMLREDGDGTGKGPELFPDNATLNPRYPASVFDNCTARTTTSQVDSLPGQAVKVAVNGANAACMSLFFGNSPIAGLISGHVYTVTLDFDYVGANPSTAARYGIGHSSANDEEFTFAATTPTVASGSGCASPAISTVGSRKQFTCTFTAPATGDLFWTFGPNSATNTKDVTLYRFSIRDAVPRD